jgi:hypothetical protein
MERERKKNLSIHQIYIEAKAREKKKDKNRK